MNQMKLCNECIWLGKQKGIHFYICRNSKSKFYKVPFLRHGKTRKACSLYEPRYSPVVLQNVPEGMRMIEALRGKFQGSDFWVLGSDPNLDFYPDDFFDDKFSIAVGMSCVAFPGSTFLYMSGRRELGWMISKHPDYLEKVILPLEPVRDKYSAKAEREMLKYRSRGFNTGIGRWESWGLEPIYMKPEDKPMLKSVPDYESTAKRIFSNGPCDFVLTRTSTHNAIFAATVLGAKKIILVGCSHKASKGRAYAHKRGMGDFISEADERLHLALDYGSQRAGIERMRRDTIQLAKVFKKFGIEIVRHRFDEDENDFMFEEIK